MIKTSIEISRTIFNSVYDSFVITNGCMMQWVIISLEQSCDVTKEQNSKWNKQVGLYEITTLDLKENIDKGIDGLIAMF